MNVLSLFDGLSGAQVALERARIKVRNYYASEIDPYAISVAKENYVNTIHLGSVTNLTAKKLPKIDLLIGGSPCTSFSSAGLMEGLQGESGLFIHYVRLLKELKPDYFFLENVKMKKRWRHMITGSLGVYPIEINSSLVSAQLRARLYWTNIPNTSIPEDRGLVLQDILESGSTDRDKSFCIDASYYKGASYEQYLKKSRRQLVFSNPPIKTRYTSDKPSHYKGKAYCLRANAGGPTRGVGVANDAGYWRKLTPIECERLQTLEDNYTKYGEVNGERVKISNTQRYKMIGNGFTVDVIAHLLRGLV